MNSYKQFAIITVVSLGLEATIASLYAQTTTQEQSMSGTTNTKVTNTQETTVPEINVTAETDIYVSTMEKYLLPARQAFEKDTSVIEKMIPKAKKKEVPNLTLLVSDNPLESAVNKEYGASKKLIDSVRAYMDEYHKGLTELEFLIYTNEIEDDRDTKQRLDPNHTTITLPDFGPLRNIKINYNGKLIEKTIYTKEGGRYVQETPLFPEDAPQNTDDSRSPMRGSATTETSTQSVVLSFDYVVLNGAKTNTFHYRAMIPISQKVPVMGAKMPNEEGKVVEKTFGMKPVYGNRVILEGTADNLNNDNIKWAKLESSYNELLRKGKNQYPRTKINDLFQGADSK